MDLLHEYNWIIDKLSSKYGIHAKKEHEYVHEFFEGPIPVMKLMYGINEKNGVRENRILVSFHLNLDSVDAIQWYLRIQNFHPTLYMVSCYFKDDNNETFLGQGAELIKMYKDEQLILANWAKDKDETKKIVAQKIVGRAKHKLSNYDFTDIDQALNEFNKMDREDKDKCH